MHLHLNPWIFIPLYVVVALGIDQVILRALRARRRRAGLATDDPGADAARDRWRADSLGRLVVLVLVLAVFGVVALLTR